MISRHRLSAVLLLQQRWRGALSALRHREHFIYLRRAAVILQAVWRGRLVRKTFLAKKDAVIILQRSIRRFLAKRVLRRMQEDEKSCQVNRVSAACIIQRRWRLHKIILRARERLSSIVAIQRRWRVIVSQRKDHHTRHGAATIIQARWRGYCVRHMILGRTSLAGPNLRRLTQIRKKLDVATTTVDNSNCIGNKTKCAISFLFKYKDLKRILQAVIVLDMSTKWSKVCCGNMISEGILPHLLSLIDSCNRSLPYMQILTYILNIFLNLVKCQETFHDITIIPNIADIMVSVMSIYHEKHPLLLNKSCTILYLLSSPKKLPLLKVSLFSKSNCIYRLF